MAKSYLDKDGLLYFLQKIRPTATPSMDGTANTGSSKRFALEDHVHPSDTTKADKSAAVTNVAWDSTNSKITKTINGNTSDVVTTATLKSAIGNASTSASGLMTTTQVTKLNGIATGAEVNQNAFSSVKYEDTTVSAGAKTDTLELINGGGVDLTLNNTDKTITVTSNIKVDGISGYTINRYGVCSTSASTAAKTVDITNGHITLVEGAEIVVKFTYVNSASNPTLNVNSLGAKNIYHKGTRITTGANKELLNGVCLLTYDGTNWHLTGDNYLYPTFTQTTGKPTANQTPGFGSTFTISQISQSTTGQISATDRTVTIPNATATTSAAGLMSAGDKTKLEGISGSTLNLVAGNNVSISPDTTNNTLTISSTNTTYSAGSADLLTTGTDTSNRVWQAKILADYVNGQIATAITGSASFQGTAPTTFAPTSYKKGYYWIVGTAGTYVGQVCEAGDMIYAIKDYASAYSASDFTVVQANLDIASITNAEIDTIVAS